MQLGDSRPEPSPRRWTLAITVGATVPWARSGEMRRVRPYALVLGILALAFLGRVLGQALVGLWSPAFLPPMEEWYSGLLPYPILLPAQIVILAGQLEVSRQLWAGSGPLVRQHTRLGSSLKWFALVYFVAMVARYVIVMAVFPERRWFGGTIPIFFHWVLAAYVYVLSRFHRGLPLGRRVGSSSA